MATPDHCHKACSPWIARQNAPPEQDAHHPQGWGVPLSNLNVL